MATVPLRVRLLGPLEVWADDGVWLAPGGKRARALLALLALDAGRWVPVSRLVDGVYGTELPGSPRHAIEAQVSRLRSRGVAIEHGPAGYRLALDPDAVDVHRFTRLAAEGMAAAAARHPVDHGEDRLPTVSEAPFLHDQLQWDGATGAAARAAAASGPEAAAAAGEAVDVHRFTRLAAEGMAAAAARHPVDHGEDRLPTVGEAPFLHDQLQWDGATGAPAAAAAEPKAAAAAGETAPATGEAVAGVSEPAAARHPVDHGEGRLPTVGEAPFLHDQLQWDGATGVPAAAAAEPKAAAAAREAVTAAGEAAAGEPGPAGGPEAAAERLRAALYLWRGPALADLAEAPFAAAAAAALEERRLAVVEDLAEAELALGRHRELTVSLASVAAGEPLRERLHGQLMRALAADGRRAEALAVFARLRERLDDQLGVSPSAELVELNVALLRSPSTTEAAPRPLPAQLTGFVGRAAEVARVRELLASGRLVTLTGPGGVGKTRLAIEAASGAAVGEVCFADLDGVDDGASLPVVLLGALGLPAAGLFPIRTGPVDVAERLVAALADRRILLVLDTCDRVVAGLAELLRRLLAAAPGVRVLATGRESFGLTGEQVWPVHPLAPDEAERLFRERAAAAAPATDHETGAIRRICAALDGLPLAIELAAARLRTLGPAELAARIDDRFALLSRGDRTAAPRHRTLHAVTAWSWDLLAAEEQRFAARVSVFAGGITAGTAAAIEPRPDDLLAALTEKSLLQHAGGRYRMLSTVREFCAARLTGDEARGVRAVHARTFLELAETAEPHLRGHGQLTWLARLDAEHDNLAAALGWSAEHDPALGLRLLTALTWHGHLRGQTGERAAVAARLAATSPDRGEAHALAVATAAAGRPAPVPYPPGPPRSPYLPLVRFMTEGPHAGVEFADDPWSRAFARVAAAVGHAQDGDSSRAKEELNAAHTAFADLGDRWGRAVALEQLGAVDEARELFRELGAVADLERLGGHVSDR